MNPQFKYYAFISYNAKDTAWGKKLIDELGPWFIMGQDKFPTYRNDAKPENLKAVCDFVQEYRPQW